MIFFAMIFDVLDGRVARYTRTAGRFGAEMDSLCDMISFGAAPALLAYATILLETKAHELIFPILDRYVLLLLVTYVSCAALRLARFNVEAETEHRDFFFGMPSPAAAGALTSWIVLFHGRRGLPPFDRTEISELLKTVPTEWVKYIPSALPFFAFLLGILMITRVRYAHVGERLLRGRKSFLQNLALIFTLVLLAMQAEIMLAVAFNGYLLIGLGQSVARRLRPAAAEPLLPFGELPPAGAPAADDSPAAASVPAVTAAEPAADSPAPAEGERS
jgi:CDP-diacylglycerol--serine O-phosphatidyltransferase